MAYAQLAAGAMQGLGQLAGAGGGTPGVSSLSDRSPINIAPTGVNIGAMLEPYRAGSVENGGYPLDIPSRYKPGQILRADYTGAKLGREDRDKASAIPILLVAGAGILALFLFM